MTHSADIDIRPFSGGDCTIQICGMERSMPLQQVDKDIWVVGNEHLSFGCDIEFTKRVASILSTRLKNLFPEVLFTAEAKSLALTYELARCLGHEVYAVARKNTRHCTKGHFETSISSITTGKQKLILDDINISRISGKRVVLVDDVISTGNTMEGLMTLADKAGAKICALASIWIEGPWPFKKFSEQIQYGRLIYLGVLPIYAKGETYNQLMEQKKALEENL